MKNPIIKIIENGLELWIKNRCNKISAVKIDIKELKQRKLNSEICNVSFTSEDLEFNHLPIKYINLKCDSIKIESNLIRRKIFVKDSFNIQGNIKLDSKGLQCALNKSKWIWLNHLIAKGLLEKEYISLIKINNNLLKLEGKCAEEELKSIHNFKIKAHSGKINIDSIDNSKSLKIPMEDSIYIEDSSLSDGLLVLKGYADVDEKN